MPEPEFFPIAEERDIDTSLLQPIVDPRNLDFNYKQWKNAYDNASTERKLRYKDEYRDEYFKKHKEYPPDINPFSKDIVHEGDALYNAEETASKLGRFGSFRNYVEKKERERIKRDALSEHELNLEARAGGIFGKDPQYGSLKNFEFTSGLVNGLTMNLVDQEHPVYGQRSRQEYGEYHGWGNTIGSIINFMALSQLTATAGVPKLITKLGTKVKPLGTLLSGMGVARTGMSKALTLFGLLGKTKDFGSPLITGAISMNLGGIGALTNGIKTSAKLFRQQDKLTKKQWALGYRDKKTGIWHEGVPQSLINGFFGKYFIGTINDPKSWPARFLGDAVYSMGEQFYEMAVGNQEGVNWSNYWRSFIQGHVMGEVQGAVFSPTTKQMLTFRKDKKNIDHLRNIKAGLEVALRDEELMTTVEAIRQAEGIAEEAGRPLTPTQLKLGYDGLIKSINKHGHTIITGLNHPDILDVKLPSYNKVIDTPTGNVKKFIADHFGYPESLVEKLDVTNPVVLKDLLERTGKLADEPKIVKDVKVIKGDPKKPNVELQRENLEKLEDLTDHEYYDYLQTTLKKITGKDIDLDRAFERRLDEGLRGDRYLTEQISKDVTPEDLYNKKWRVAEPKSGKYRDPAEVKKEWNAILNDPEQTFIKKATKINPDGFSDMWIKMGELPDEELRKIDIPVEKYILNNIKTKKGVDISGKGTQQRRIRRVKVKDYDEEGNEIEVVKDVVEYVASIDEVVAGEEGSEITRADQIADLRSSIEDNVIGQIGKNREHRLNRARQKYIQERESKNIMRAIAHYAHHVKGLEFNEIARIINELGIGIDKKSLYTYDDVKNRRNQLISGVGELLGSKTIVTERTEQKVRYTDADIKKIINRALKSAEKKSNVSGLEKNLDDPTYQSRVKNNGAYVLSLDDMFQIEREYNRNVADKVNRKFASIIHNISENINRNWFTDKRKVYLGVKNPDNADGTSSNKYILYQNNMSDTEFANAIHYIYRNLTRNFDSTLEHHKRFAITIEQPGGKKAVMTNFKNITLTWGKNPEALLATSEKAVALRQLYEYFTGGRLKNSSIDEDTISDIEADLRIDLVPKMRSNDWDAEFGDRADPVDAELYNRANDIIGDLQARAIAVREYTPEEKNFMELRNKRVEKPLKEDFQQQLHKSRVIEENDTEFEIERIFSVAGVDDPIMMSNLKALSKFGQEKMKGLGGVINSMIDHAEKGLEVTEKLEMDANFKPIISRIYELASRGEELGMNASEEVVRALKPYLEGQSENAKEAFDVLIPLIIESEKKATLNPDGTPKISPDAYRQPIIGEKTGETIRLEGMNGDHRRISRKFLMNFRDHTKDDLTYQKVLVQEFGFDPEKLLGAISSFDKNIMAPVERAWLKNLLGENVNYKFLSEQMDKLEKGVGKAIVANIAKDKAQAKNLTRELSKINMSDKKAVSELKKYLPQIENEAERLRVARMIGYIERIDPTKLSYFHHMILGSKVNRKVFASQMESFINGKADSGPQVIDPVMKEFSGRKMMTIEMALKEGYDVERSGTKVATAMLKYAYEKRANQLLAESYKSTFVKQFNSAYNKALEVANAGDLEGAKKILFTFFEDTTGYFYIPADSEFALIDKQMKLYEKNIEAVQNRGVTSTQDVNKFVDKFQKGILDLNARKAELQKILDVYSGQDKVLQMTSADADIIARKLIVDADEKFIPMNYNSFIKTSRTGMGNIFSSITNKVGKMRAPNLTNWDGLYMHRVMHKMFANLVFRNDFAGDDYEYSYQKTIVRAFDKANNFMKAIRFYKPWYVGIIDMVQGSLLNPASAFYGPYGFKAVMERYDNKVKIEKGWDNPRKQTAIRYFLDERNGIAKRNPDGSLSWVDANKGMKFLNEHPGTMHRLFMRKNLFNKSVSWGQMISDAQRASFEVMGKNKFFGGLSDAVTGRGNSIARFFGIPQFSFKSWQGATWFGDEAIRTAVAKSMFNKYAKAWTLEEALQKSADQTNNFLANYSRRPKAFRRGFNRVSFVPTYRFEMARLYKTMLRDFARGTIRAVTGKAPTFSKDIQKTPLFTKLEGETRSEKLRSLGIHIGKKAWNWLGEDQFELYKDSPRRQALFEMSPILRAVGFGAGLKVLLGQIFGYSFGDMWEMIGNYRGKKFKDAYSLMDSELEFISLGTPLFEIQKYMRRPFLVTLRYNSAALPGLIWMLALNQDMITGKPIRTVSFEKNPGLASAQTGMSILRTFFPVMRDWTTMNRSDISLMKNLITFSGMAFFYKIGKPADVLRDFNEAIDVARTPEDRRQALREFHGKMRYLHQALFKEKYVDVQEYVRGLREEAEQE